MKYLKVLTLFFAICSSFQLSAQLKAGTIVRTKEGPTRDSVVYYESDIATRQKSFMNLLTGTWDVKVMKKQAKAEADHLNGITLTLNKDSSFTGQFSCNKIWGKFSVKGTSVKFNDIASTKNTCSKQEEETWLIQLLQETVSNYSVTKPNLLLRDGSGNVVFEAIRKN